MTPAGAIVLTWPDLALAASLIAVSAAVSLALNLRMGRTLLLASVRTLVQLLLVGLVLKWVFGLNRAPAVLGICAIMIIFAGRAAVGRASRTFPGATVRAIAALAVSATLTGLAVTQVIIGTRPWYQPQYLIPLLGMILGNSLTGISLCLDSLLESFTEKANEIELFLSMGATRGQAARPHVAEAVRRGMIPILNAMMVAGVVSLPGMMTGQILAGADPMQAVMYQVVVMFMLAAATALGSVLIAVLTTRRHFNERHQLVAGAIRKN